MIVRLLIPFLILTIPFKVLSQESFPNQRISIQLKQVNLDDALMAISEQTGIRFSYNSRQLRSDKTVNVNLQDKSIKEVLGYLSDHFQFDYQWVRGQMVLRPTPKKEVKDRFFTISGTVRDAETGETLPGASISVDGNDKGTITNSYGFFSLSLLQGEYTLLFKFIGYETLSNRYSLYENVSVQIDLTSGSLALGEISIVYNKEVEWVKQNRTGQVNIDPKKLEGFSSFVGENSLVANLQSYPGIKPHSDGSAFFYVRGGGRDQNLILIDEAPIFNPAHLFGFYSVIFPDVSKSINIYKGNIPFEKGGRLSSVIDIQTKDGNMKRVGVEGSIHPLMSRLAVEGPIKKDVASFYISVRRSHFEWLLGERNVEKDLHIRDLHFKVNTVINEKNRLFFSLFSSIDNFVFYNQQNQETGIRWQNFTSTIRWNRFFSHRLFSNLTLYASSYNYYLLLGRVGWESAISNLGLAYDWSFYQKPGLITKFGITYSGHNFNPGNLYGFDESPYTPFVSKSGALQTAAYVSREHKITEKFSYTAGFRLPFWVHTGPAVVFLYNDEFEVVDGYIEEERKPLHKYLNIDPGVTLSYSLSQKSSLKFSYNINHQYLHLLSNSISPFSSFEVWMPSSVNIKPGRANQVNLGINIFFPKANIEFSADLYHKKMHNQIEYAEHANLLLNPLIEGQLRFGISTAYGVELMLRRQRGRLNGWISYTWSRVLNRFDDINQGRTFPAFHDRPHDLSIYSMYQINNKLSVSANWIFYSGAAITTPVSFYEYMGSIVPLYSDKNNDRLPNYHRLDVSFTRNLHKPGNRYEHFIILGLYNLYNRQNPISINFNKMKTRNGKLVVPADIYQTPEIFSTQKSLLGFVPSLTYKFKF